jgi:hypothetical protein
MGINRNKFKDEPSRINVLLQKDIKKKYKQYCLEKDYIMSERIRELIEKDLKENSK